MSKAHPNNGPTFSKTLPKKRQRPSPPSPDRVRAQQEEAKRDAADRKLMATDPRSWLRKHRLVKS
jgi:hypothetical protein